MYEDKTLVCKECGNEFVFTAGEQEFYAEKALGKDLRTSPRDARLAEMPERQQAEQRDRPTQQFVLLAAERLLSHSSPERTVLYTAASVSLR